MKISCDFKIDHIIDYMSGEDIYLPPNETFELQIDYPCDKTIFKINTGAKGMGSFGLVKEIGKGYQEIYKNAETTNPFNVWGHGIEDLALEGIDVDFTNKKIKLHVGS